MMGRLNVVFERYPELKASDLYREAQEGMKQYEENVRMSRMIYNDTATKMNRMVRQWPSLLLCFISTRKNTSRSTARKRNNTPTSMKRLKNE